MNAYKETVVCNTGTESVVCNMGTESVDIFDGSSCVVLVNDNGIGREDACRSGHAL